ncbi:hypothetical protein N7U66_02220 [Lacinutrix neustonica]|uniref:DUF4112 domain-containing protein n=1 Tax=Lacinutrix neustonica TaxID=2980107 RepID=A0A9E8MW16_9FLAO|nr:hypothetical protein [Lacinutrix neustonica]WAC02543.1 hypothetical protein N7U66_02220 [Lacinutrix neustonica]
MNLEHLNKYKKLAASILFDAIGYASFIIPGIGEIIDLAWAPASAWLMTKMYKGPAGKVGAAVSFIEEIMPGLDVVPTFTLMWLYTYVFHRQSEAPTDEQVIKIK